MRLTNKQKIMQMLNNEGPKTVLDLARLCLVDTKMIANTLYELELMGFIEKTDPNRALLVYRAIKPMEDLAQYPGQKPTRGAPIDLGKKFGVARGAVHDPQDLNHRLKGTKRAQRRQVLADDVKAWLAAGNQIDQIPSAEMPITSPKAGLGQANPHRAR